MTLLGKYGFYHHKPIYIANIITMADWWEWGIDSRDATEVKKQPK
jgi:hypothetical protein